MPTLFIKDAKVDLVNERDDLLLYFAKQIEAADELASAAYFARKSASYARFELTDKGDGLDCHEWDDLKRAMEKYRATKFCRDSAMRESEAFHALIQYRQAKEGTLRRSNVGFDPTRDDGDALVSVEEAEGRMLKALAVAVEANRRAWNVLNGREPDDD